MKDVKMNSLRVECLNMFGSASICSNNTEGLYEVIILLLPGANLASAEVSLWDWRLLEVQKNNFTVLEAQTLSADLCLF